MSQNYICMNDQGNYLVYGEVSRHSANKTYGYSWTPKLDEASIITSLSALKQLNWLYGSPPIKDIVATLPVEVIRVIKIVKAEEPPHVSVII